MAHILRTVQFVLRPVKNAKALRLRARWGIARQFDGPLEIFYNYSACSQVSMIHFQKKFFSTLKKKSVHEWRKQDFKNTLYAGVIYKRNAVSASAF